MPGLGATDPADLEAQARAELSFLRRPMYSLLSLRPTVIQATLKRCPANRKSQHDGTGHRRRRRRQNHPVMCPAGRRQRQQHRGRILLHIIVVPDCWHRNPPWLIGGGLVRLGRHRKNNMQRGRLRQRRRRCDDDDNYRKQGWRFLHRCRERKTAHGSTRAVNAAEERPRSRRDGGVLDPAPRRIVRGQHDPWTSGIREACVSRRLANFCLVLAVRVGGRSRSGGGGWEGGLRRLCQCCRRRPPDTTRSRNVAWRHYQKGRHREYSSGRRRCSRE